jgi:hypothetical protein
VARPLQHLGIMWLKIASVCALALVGCATPQELVARSDHHLQLSRAAYAEGDRARAVQEQEKAEWYYDRAAVRATQQARPVPAPPTTQPVFPLRPVRTIL